MSNCNIEFVGAKQTAKMLGIHSQTLHNWAQSGKIDYIKKDNGYRMFNVKKFLKDNMMGDINEYLESKKKNICYCRVSTHGQKEDLERQIKYMKEKYPKYELITDIGSGINFKRKGLNEIIDYSLKKEIGNVVVAYKDRLCRIGYDLIENLIEKIGGGKIIIENKQDETAEEEISNDIIQILNVYSAKINGKRKYKKIENKN